jgi:peptidoglycan-N-acetylglucosamine deacetylase
MSRRWHWDFEASGKPSAPPPVPPVPPRPGASESAGAAPPLRPHVPSRYRRRRGAAVLVLIGVIVLLVAVLSGSSGTRTGARSSARGQAPDAGKARARPPSEDEKDLKSAVASVFAFTPFVREGGTRGRDVALTFDDGPGPYTPGVLSVLERYHVHATFFVIGRMLRYFGSSTVREVEDGDVIGDHTESHPMLAELSAHDQYEQLFEQIIRVESVGAKRPTLWRPPYGSFDSTTLREAKRLHLLMVLWSADTSDYQQPGVAAIVERVLAGAHPGAIILMHDGGGVRTETIEALPQIIRGLRARGYKLVTVPQLLADDPPPAGQPLPSSLAGD